METIYCAFSLRKPMGVAIISFPILVPENEQEMIEAVKTHTNYIKQELGSDLVSGPDYSRGSKDDAVSRHCFRSLQNVLYAGFRG